MPLLLALLAGTARAQERTVTGTVTDSTTGSPLAGVQVALEPGGQRTQTRDNGSFALAGVPDQEVTLVFRLIGYRRGAVRLAAGEAGTVTIALARDPFKLEEVVVTGQFTGQERRNLANAISTVGAEDLEQVPAPGIEQQLQGKVAGADIQENSGAPGGGLQVRLRGVTSINAPAQPLYVIDGVIMSDVAIPSNQNAVTAASQGSNPELTQDAQVNRIVDLNPGDIERIEVLKGASAATIYGVRASNGVVIITTKTPITTALPDSAPRSAAPPTRAPSSITSRSWPGASRCRTRRRPASAAAARPPATSPRGSSNTTAGSSTTPGSIARGCGSTSTRGSAPAFRSA